MSIGTQNFEMAAENYITLYTCKENTYNTLVMTTIMPQSSKLLSFWNKHDYFGYRPLQIGVFDILAT